MSEDQHSDLKQRGLLISSGLITGEALVGILMAIPIVASGKSDVFAFLGIHDFMLPGIILIIGLMIVMHFVSTSGMNKK